MNGTFPYPERVPAAAVERILRNIAGLLQAIVGALSEAGTPHAARWQRAYDLLAAEQAQLQAEAEAFLQGDHAPLLQHASALRLLIRGMDGYPLDFAGAEAGKALAAQRQLLVFTAWQIAAVASGVESAGL